MVAAIRKAGGRALQTGHGATDHSWSNRRIDLEAWIARSLRSRLRPAAEPKGNSGGESIRN